MNMALRLMAHISDTGTALTALRQLPKGVSFTDYDDLAGTPSLAAPFTAGDVRALVADKRMDLAQVVLAYAADPRMLDEMVEVSMASPLARPLAANSRTSTATLLRMSRDPRAVVSRPASSALARRCGLRVKDAGYCIPILSQVLDCPIEEASEACSKVAADALTPALYSTALAAVAERPEDLPGDLVELLLSLSLHEMAWYGMAHLPVALSRHRQVTAEQLLALARATREKLNQVPAVPLEAVSRAALDRGGSLPSSDRRWLACRLFESASIHDRSAALLLDPEDALEFAMSTTHPWRRTAALDCPGISPQAVEALLLEVSVAVMAGRSRAFGLGSSVPAQMYAVLAHPHVKGALLDRALGLAQNLQALSWIVRNPNLTALQWQRLVDTLEPGDVSRMLEPISRSPSAPPEMIELALAALDPSVTEARALGRVFPVGPPLVGEWGTHRIAEALCENEAFDDEAIGSLPAAPLRSRWASHSVYSRLSRVAVAELGSDPRAWQAFVTLQHDWDGSFAELLSASTSL